MYITYINIYIYMFVYYIYTYIYIYICIYTYIYITFIVPYFPKDKHYRKFNFPNILKRTEFQH